MSEKRHANVILQMVFAAIPVLDIFASYKIQKLGSGLLLFWVGGMIVQIVQFFVFFGEGHYVLFGEFEARLPESVVLFTILFVIFKVMVMRKWSEEWNRQFDIKIKDFN